MRKPIQYKEKEGFYFFGISIGKIKHLFDRYRNYLAWCQIPLLLYTSVIATLQYFPVLNGYLIELFLIGVFCFITLTITVMIIDFKFVFPSEREFMYSGTPYFERRFGIVEDKLNALTEAAKK